MTGSSLTEAMAARSGLNQFSQSPNGDSKPCFLNGEDTALSSTNNGCFSPNPVQPVFDTCKGNHYSFHELVESKFLAMSSSAKTGEKKRVERFVLLYIGGA